MFVPREAELKYAQSDIDFKQFNFFTYSRDAIYKIAQEIKLTEEDEVLIPDYICNTVINTLHEFTKNIRLYKIDKNLHFESGEIKLLLNNKTKMIIFVDYFGVEAEVHKSLVKHLRENKVTILKDAAHSFLTLVRNDFNSIYKYDYLVSSIYKNLPLHVGAICIGKFSNTNKFVNTNIFYNRLILTFIKKVLCFFGISVINRNIDNLSIVNDSYKFSNGGNYYDKYIGNLKNVDYEKIVSNRGDLSIDFYNYFKNNSIFSIEEIQKSSLQSFPIWCSSQEKRDKVLGIMRKECIDVFTWATFHKSAVNRYLWSHILLIPIDKKVLEFIKENNIDV